METSPVLSAGLGNCTSRGRGIRPGWCGRISQTTRPPRSGSFLSSSGDSSTVEVLGRQASGTQPEDGTDVAVSQVDESSSTAWSHGGGVTVEAARRKAAIVAVRGVCKAALTGAFPAGCVLSPINRENGRSCGTGNLECCIGLVRGRDANLELPCVDLITSELARWFSLQVSHAQIQSGTLY
ncbi:hypothetical protein N657DRAFT_238485 [Parathielavia appendiculata]|uniref:Uncharacterized protein n=1 Tax=Parathielavia appendiculata TaxID=2587402 RepID=A0AAN6Z806_9PEZI|nr:hypothetical protein N657DRAFT_238485 [Parathielavia appendiculata]